MSVFILISSFEFVLFTFQFIVARSLASCQGALLLVDSTQSVQAQTLANHAKAKSLGKSIWLISIDDILCYFILHSFVYEALFYILHFIFYIFYAFESVTFSMLLIVWYFFTLYHLLQLCCFFMAQLWREFGVLHWI